MSNNHDEIGRYKSNINICITCEKSCGRCPWTAVDEKTGRGKFEPVPGWTAEKVMLRVGSSHSKRVSVETYHITACPLYEPSRRGRS